MKKLLFLSLLALCATPAIFADFGDVFGPTVAGATIGGLAGGGRGAGIGAAVGFGVGALNSSARDRAYYNYDDGYYNGPQYDNSYNSYSRPVLYRDVARGYDQEPYEYGTESYIVE